MSATLVVMARPPMRGRVKTRLAAGIGDDEALAAYRRLVAGTFAEAERLRDVRLVVAVAGADGPGHPAPADGEGSRRDHAGPTAQAMGSLEVPGERWERIEQRGDGLGERVANVLADLFRSGVEAVVIVNSDSPPIPSGWVRRALAAARMGQLALGPTADGGYYLIGCGRELWLRRRTAVTGLLVDSPMSEPSLLTWTMRRARAAGITPSLVPLWIDVDEPGDLDVLGRLAAAEPLRGEPLGGLREVYLHVTHACGRDCRHCYDRDDACDPDELATDEWKTAIDDCVALGAKGFVFIGGDPLLRADFTELVEHVTGRRGAKARFFFNCRIDARRATELAGAGNGRLRPLASIDGPRTVNDGLRGPGSYDDVMASISDLRAAGLDPVANTVLVRPALPGLPQLARELRAAGVSRLHLILPHQTRGAGEGGADLIPTGEELLTAVRRLLHTAAEIGLLVDNLTAWRRRIGARNDFCAAGCRDLAIDPYGQVHACVITAGDPAFVAGSLRDQPLERIWRESPSLRLLRASRARDRAACAGCPVVDACGGECWAQAHYAARAHDQPAGYTAPYPYCDFVRPMLQELAADGAPAGSTCEPTGVCGGQAAAGTADYALFDCI